jgi:hypothetical protein
VLRRHPQRDARGQGIEWKRRSIPPAVKNKDEDEERFVAMDQAQFAVKPLVPLHISHYDV